MAVPTLTKKISTFDTIYKDSNNNIVYSKLTRDTIQGTITTYPYLKIASAPVYDPALNPNTLTDKMDYHLNTTTAETSSNFILTVKPKVQTSQTLSTTLSQLFYSHVNEYTTDVSGTYENFTVFYSAFRADAYIFISPSVSLSSDFNTLQSLYAGSLNKRKAINSTQFILTAKELNEGYYINPTIENVTYADGSTKKYIPLFQEYRFLMQDNNFAFKILVRRNHRPYSNALYSYCVLAIMPENVFYY